MIEKLSFVEIEMEKKVNLILTYVVLDIKILSDKFPTVNNAISPYWFW